VGDHHALRPGGRPAGVVDGDEVVLVDGGPVERGACVRDGVLVVEPAWFRPTLEGDEVFDLLQVVADAVDGVEVVAVRADDPGPEWLMM
jgi:hypothetical protein